MQRKDLALRVLSTAAIMSIVTSIAAPAFADIYYIGNGSIDVVTKTGTDGEYVEVTQNGKTYTDGLMCVENTFEKGAVGALHHHPHTQITYVVSGAFEFTVDGVTHTVRAGDTILKEDGMEHG